MSRSFLFSIAAFFPVIATAQERTAIEFSLLSRYDRHANYTTNFAGRSFDDTLKLYGISYGMNLGLRKPVSPSLSAYFAVAYYRLGITKIDAKTHPRTAVATRGRPINNEDDDSTRFLHATSQYRYNNLAFTAGINRPVSLKGIKLELGIEAVSYYSLSQGYVLGNGYRYKTTHHKPLELGINATAGFVKEYGKLFIRPELLLPIYQNLKGDEAFYEDRQMNISKWFNGIGLTIRIGRYL